MKRDRLQSYANNGPKAKPTFSAGEMARRQDMLRAYMAEKNIDAALFTSYHNVNYYGDFLYCQIGRRYGLVVDHNKATSISTGIDGGQPWRRTAGENITYTDWQKDNYFHAVRGLIRGAKRVGLEFDHVNIDFLKLLETEFSDVEFVDVAEQTMRLRMINSALLGFVE